MNEHDIVVEICLDLETFARSKEMSHLACAMRDAVTAAKLDALLHVARVTYTSGDPVPARYTDESNVTPLRAKQYEGGGVIKFAKK
jgi:hypothetical protein